MNINRLNNQQFLCNLSMEELHRCGFNKDTLFDGNDSTAAFFSALIDTALEKTNESEDIIIQNCMFKVNEQSGDLEIIINTEEDICDEELDDEDILIEDENEEIEFDDNEFVEKYNNYKNVLERLLKETEENKPFLILKTNSLDFIIELSKNNFPDYSFKSTLLKKENIYLLIINISKLKKEELQYLIFNLCDFIDIGYLTELEYAYLNEHIEVIIKEDAIKKLQYI